jgi:hypothetical protein
MHVLSIVAAGGSGDLLVGLLIGCCIGILVGPAFRAWQVHREWTDASREAGLADRLLEQMDLDLADRAALLEDDDDVLGGSAWRTRR